MHGDFECSNCTFVQLIHPLNCSGIEVKPNLKIGTGITMQSSHNLKASLSFKTTRFSDYMLCVHLFTKQMEPTSNRSSNFIEFLLVELIRELRVTNVRFGLEIAVVT